MGATGFLRSHSSERRIVRRVYFFLLSTDCAVALKMARRHHAGHAIVDPLIISGMGLGALISVSPLIVLASVVARIARRLIVGIRINRDAKADDQSSGWKKPSFATSLFR